MEPRKSFIPEPLFLIFVVLSCISLISIMMGWLKPNPIILIGGIIVIGAFLWEQTMKRFKS
ncbi:hypothetical protein A7H74_17290 [Salmonella enterica subsp. enterica serovar Anatum]|uniref:Uncharacterized protein n=1 Tax=Salmonella anatum TaxID=58712 RepID=A0A4Z9MXE0_SALAN|nr:hypothetical protein AW58_24740 [Salmonella enterica subsp. enterica serovar Anatum str. USDA-ARS-USMARC-1765]EAB0235958.1 hypothetical protein [Salmonella enterica subsp. enterica serovar Anatum]EAZ9550463.1 hypothetical protein [Salmonella enterica]EDL5267291.1 hypothetical protein [Salmonella enterica subsp. enterica serovar Enteritidis]EBD3372892.1 hypothetical protein [Salmonella enterica]